MEVALEGAGVLDLESWPWLESLLEADEAWTASDTWEAMAEYLMGPGRPLKQAMDADC